VWSWSWRTRRRSSRASKSRDSSRGISVTQCSTQERSHEDAVDEARDHAHVVGDHQDRARGVQAVQQGVQVVLHRRVEAGGGLSSSRISGSPASARAISTFWRWPPDSSEKGGAQVGGPGRRQGGQGGLAVAAAVGAGQVACRPRRP
jgi:hypothetical protein